MTNGSITTDLTSTTRGYTDLSIREDCSAKQLTQERRLKQSLYHAMHSYSFATQIRMHRNCCGRFVTCYGANKVHYLNIDLVTNLKNLCAATQCRAAACIALAQTS